MKLLTNEMKRVNYYIKLSFLLLLMVQSPCLKANNRLDSLKAVLVKVLPDSQRIETLQKIYSLSMDLDLRKEASQYLKSTFALALKMGNKEKLAWCYMCSGQYNNAINNYVVALDHLMEALRLYRELKHTRGEAATLMNLGIAYFTMKDYERALNYFHKAEGLFIKNNDPDKLGIINYLNAHVFLRKGWTYASIKIFKGLLTSGNKLDNQRKNECLLGIGSAFLKMRMTDSAAYYINTSYQYFDSVGNGEAKCYAGSYLSEYYFDTGQPGRAIDSGLVNLDLALKIGHRDAQLQLYKTLSDTYHQLGDIDKAFLYQQKYFELKDALFNESSLRQLNVLQQKNYDIQRRQDLVLLEHQKESRKAINLAIISLLIIVLFSLIYRFSLKQRVNKQLEISNQKLEVNNVQLADINHELNKTLEVLKDTQEKLVQQEKIASLGKVTAGIAHEIQNPLNFVTNFATLNSDLINELNGNLEEEDRKEAIALLLQNNEKIRHHGMRANVIVRDMLMEAREDSLKKEATDINKLLRENFDFSYQAFKTKTPGFNCDTKLYIQNLPKMMVEQRQLGRVFLNIFDNALYASKNKATSDADYKPRIIIKTTTHESNARIIIEDNGKGIAPEILKDIFNPFFTTKPTGDGTGLGLSICYEIITKRHHGIITVESELNQYTRFIIDLPLPVNSTKQ